MHAFSFSIYEFDDRISEVVLHFIEYNRLEVPQSRLFQ